MGLSKCLFLFLIIYFLKGCNTITSSDQSYCHEEETAALLQFKQSFTISCGTDSSSSGAYPKTRSWKSAQAGNKTNCCTWDGVECDTQTGYVIGLDLKRSCLYGSINSNSSLFRLVHLQRLSLADNDFNFSHIPSTIRNFPSLTYLDLSGSVFSGLVPSQLSQLVKLSLLNLSSNTDPTSGEGLLRLDGSDFRNIVQNITGLEHLRLRYINISSTIPHSMANLSFLTTLDLHECELFGDFPVSIFHLPNLRSIYVRDNQGLSGNLPEFNRTSRLKTLDLHATNFSIKFPSSIGKIESLEQLDVGACRFSSELVPSSLGNLRKLKYLDLSWLFQGPIPESFANLTKLQVFRMNSCRLTGAMPSWLGKFSQLRYLDFATNTLNSSIPSSIFNLTSLEWLYIQRNQLRGRLEFQMFQSLQSLTELDISVNNLELVSKPADMNATNFPQLVHLILRNLNLSEFPYFLTNQRSLEHIEFSYCNLQGQVPKWMYNVITQTLRHLALDTNHLSGQFPALLPWVNLQFFNIFDNNFHGSLPVPASSTVAYIAEGNSFMGKVSPLFFNLSSLQILDLSNNSLSGTISDGFRELRSLQALSLSHNNFGGTFPQFLGNFSDNLVFLLLGNNLFHGHLPQVFSKKSNLRFIDVSYNKLEGTLPRSLGNCLMLETLVMSDNNLSGFFPFWLRTLPELKVLAMRQNGFLGTIGKPEDTRPFPKLRILDISHNNFTGKFQAEYIFTVYAIRSNVSVNDPTYLGAVISAKVFEDTIGQTFGSTFTVTSKGVDRYYSKIHKAMTFIDISSNKFEGGIDGWIGNLDGLHFLNVSNNLLTGGIPFSFGNLINLESLDLSSNKLSGNIPPQLAQLTFLEEFNVSNNNLSGHIPTGAQLQTFQASSYEGNFDLCGDPLPMKCDKPNTANEVQPFDTEDNSFWFGFEFDWKFVVSGFGSGSVVGVVLADLAITRRPEIFLDIVGRLVGLMEMVTRCKMFVSRH